MPPRVSAALSQRPNEEPEWMAEAHIPSDPAAALLVRRPPHQGGAWAVEEANAAFAQHAGALMTAGTLSRPAGQRDAGGDDLSLLAERAVKSGTAGWWQAPHSGADFQLLPLGTDRIMLVQVMGAGQAREGRFAFDELFRQLLDAAPDAMVIVDANGVIVLANEQAERLFGHARTALLGEPVEILIPESLGAAHRGHRSRYAEDPHFRMMGQGLELRGKRKDGSEFPVEISLSPLKTDGGLLISASVRDITARKAAEEALRRNEERMRTVLDTTYDAFVVMDEQGRITEWNKRAERMFGLTREQAIGQEVANTVIPAEYREAHRHGLAHFLSTGDGPVLNNRLELTATRGDGSLFPIELTITPLRHGDTWSFNAFIADITERKRAERLFRGLLESAPDAMVIVDEQGTIKLVNAQAERLFGHPRAALTGKPVEMLVPGRSRDVHRAHRGGFFAAPHTRMMGAGLDLHGLHKDGHEFPVEISLSPLETDEGRLVSAAIRDITERKRTEAEIRQLNRTLEERVEQRTAELVKSEERFHQAMDRMMEGVQVIDREWRYIYVNDALVSQSTYTREELLGHTMMERYPGIERTEMFAVLEQCFADGKARTMENGFRFPNGRAGVYELSIQLVGDSLFVLSTDISARKRAEREVLAHAERLRKQNKELEQFAYIASHDLQEPLRMVTSYVELLQRRYGERLDDAAQEFIGFAVDGARRMKRLIEDLLMYSRLDRPVDEEDVDLDATLREVRKNLEAAITESGATLTHGPLPTVRTAPSAMTQVLQNLISNAIKFRRPGTPPTVHVEATGEEDHWNISVRDNGIGIDMDYADQIFIPFKRLHTSAVYSGTGIGLAVAKKVVERGGGRIYFTSEPGGGTTFHFTVPRTTPGP